MRLDVDESADFDQFSAWHSGAILQRLTLASQPGGRSNSKSQRGNIGVATFAECPGHFLKKLNRSQSNCDHTRPGQLVFPLGYPYGWGMVAPAADRPGDARSDNCTHHGNCICGNYHIRHYLLFDFNGYGGMSGAAA